MTTASASLPSHTISATAKNSPISPSSTMTPPPPTTVTSSSTTTGGGGEERASYDYLTVWTPIHTNEDHRNKKEIEEFRAALQPTFHAYPDQELVREAKILDTACLRFLRARHFAVDKAVQHFKRALQVRVQQHIDAVLLSPFTTAAAFNRILCRGFHGYDRVGRPIYVERIGCIDVDMVNSAMTLQQRLAFCRYQAEYIRKIEFPRASARVGKRIDQVVILVDMRGFNRHHIRPSQYTFIHALTSNDSLLYPERLAYTVLINVPTVFSLVWRVVSAWMDAQMRAKFFLFSTDEAEKARTELTRRIDPIMLPACMGGLCKCGPISLPPPLKQHDSSITLAVDVDAATATINSTTAVNSIPTLTTTASTTTSSHTAPSSVSSTSSTSTDLSTSTTTASLQSSIPSVPTTGNNSTSVADVVSFYAARATSDSPPTTLTTTTSSTPPNSSTAVTVPTNTATPTTSTPTPTPPGSSSTSTTPSARTQAASVRAAAPVAAAVSTAAAGNTKRGSAPVAAALATSPPVTSTTAKRSSLPSSSSSGFFSATKSATSSSPSSPQHKRTSGGGGGGMMSISGPVSGHASAYKWDPDYCLTSSRENRQFLDFCLHGLGIHTPEQAALAAAATAAAAAAAQVTATTPGEHISREDESRIAASVEHAEQMEKQLHVTKH